MKTNFLEYANGYQSEIRLETDRITRLLDMLGHPDNDLTIIHVAGTNGKGSVCAFLESIFMTTGKKVGKYSSPELICVNERISINGENISTNDANKLLKEIECFSPEINLSPYEIWTAAALLYFKRQSCDIVILETGMGGEGDATCAINAPAVSVITKIAMDHMQYLGNTVEKIAEKKAGIIKHGVDSITVCGPQTDTVFEIIKSRAEKNENKFFTIDKPQIKQPNMCKEIFNYGDISDILCGICGYHQIENACIAIQTDIAMGVCSSDISTGIKNVRHAARFELFEPNIIFDGAHNENGISALSYSIKRYFKNITPIFIMGMMKDKDIDSALTTLSKSYPNARIITVPVKDNPRAINPIELAKKAQSYGFIAKSAKSVSDAMHDAENSELIVVCGSLYLYKSFLEYITNR